MAAQPLDDQQDLVAKAKVVLAERKRAIQLTLAALAETQAAIAKLEEQRRSPLRYFGVS